MNPLEFAVRMEIDGEQFYLRQTELFADTVLAVIFRKLAEAERKHADLIREHLAGFSDVLPSTPPLSSLKNIFSDMADFRRKAYNLPDQLDVYRLAVGVEQRSIDLYSELLRRAAAGSTDEAMLEFLLEQETNHLALFEELTELLNRPKEWVESAEFGPREEY